MKAHIAKTSLNGLDTGRMFETIDAVKKDSTLARFQFRAKNRWVGGVVNESTISDFYGAGREDTSRDVPFALVTGEPPVLLGENEGPNSMEYLLHALAGCVTTTFVMHAAARGIRVGSISTRLYADGDLRGFLALDESVSPAAERIRLEMEIEADANDETIAELLEFAKAHSPIYQTVCRPIPVEVERVPRKRAAKPREASAHR